MKINVEKLSKLNPSAFTVEDIREAFGFWQWTAKKVLGTAVRRGDFGTDGKVYWIIPPMVSN